MRGAKPPANKALTRRRGQAIVEFALIALVLYLLLAATIEYGRLILGGQVIQDATRVAAREIALTPLPAQLPNFNAILTDPDLPSSPEVDLVRARIYDCRALVVPVTTDFATLPLVNQMLRPLMVPGTVDGNEVLHYPGAILRSTLNPAVFTVKIPRVRVPDTPPHEFQQIDWVNVVEEVQITDPDDPPPLVLASRFPLIVPGGGKGGKVVLRINYPFQSAALSSYYQDNPLDPQLNGGKPVVTNDGDFTPPPNTTFVQGAAADGTPGTYAGPAGLGRHFAMGREVRPFRKLLSAQAIFRREVFR